MPFYVCVPINQEPGMIITDCGSFVTRDFSMYVKNVKCTTWVSISSIGKCTLVRNVSHLFVDTSRQRVLLAV